MNVVDIKRMIDELSARVESESISPSDLGELLSLLTDYIQSVEQNGGTLGVRKVYASVAEMLADETPIGQNNISLKRGNLVIIYNEVDAGDNGKVYAFLKPGWQLVSKLDTGIAFTQDEKRKIALILEDGDANKFLGADGRYHEVVIPEAPVQGIVVNGKQVLPDPQGMVAISTNEGTVRTVTLNGRQLSPGEDGDIAMNIDIVHVDKSLDTDSTNAVENAAVAARFLEIEAAIPAGMDAALNEDESKVTLSLLNKHGRPFTSVEIPAGKGGSGDVSATRISLVASLNKLAIKQGDAVMLTYAYDHLNTDNSSTGARADITLTIKRGAQILLEQTTSDVSKGVYNLDITKYVEVGTTDVYVKAVVRTAEGKLQTRQAYASVRSYSLSLASSYNLAPGTVGYTASESVEVPFTVTGAGDKQVLMYVDGVERDTRSVSKSGVTNGTFVLPLQSLNAGRHTVQLVAVMTIGELTIRSSSVFFDFYKGVSDDTPRICVKFERADGDISNDAYLGVAQYDALQFSFAVFHPQKQPVDVNVVAGTSAPVTLSVNRVSQSYTTKFTKAGVQRIMLTCGEVTSVITVNVKASSIDIEEVALGRVLHLSAQGRSNAEQQPAKWGDAIFIDPDFSAGGWTGDALSLVNGAGLHIPHNVFGSDATTSGKTIEIEYKCDNVIDKEASVFSCMNAGMGFEIKAQEALMRTAGGAQVGTKFAAGIFFRIAFVVRKKADGRLLEIFVNGVRSGAVQYGVADALIHSTSQGITISSANADVAVRSVSIYDRALSDDDILNNYIATRPSPDEIIALYRDNDTLGDDMQISIEKIRAKGKSVMRVVGDINLLNQTNNKKFEVQVDVYFFSAFGKAFDFILRKGGMRIQGTSSTTYPRKNYRIYFDRKKKYGTTLEVGGIQQNELKYSFKPGAMPVSLFTLKADFAESSSTHNTGLAIIINDAWKKAGILTPPQRINDKVRIGIDGFPIDFWYDNNASNKNRYAGKYNFNNDKAASAEVFGFEGENCICLEFLNNSYPLGLFATDDMSGFSDALEFRYPEDLSWEDASEVRKNAVRRLWEWVLSCKNNPSKFKSEVAQYFDVENLCAWYIATDYFMMCDQRVKNMMLATWDAQKWYFIPYDNDTVLGVRNDGKLVYDYTITEESYDHSAKTYCFAGHDSVLWQLTRTALADKLMEVAQKIRATMSKEYVLEILNKQQMNNWSARVYNKDGAFKYIQPLLDNGIDYLYSLQGSRYAHRTYIIENRFALLDAKYLAGTYRADSLRMYFSYKFSNDNKQIHIVASERYYFGYGYTSGTPRQSGVLAEQAGSSVSLTLDSDLIVNDPQFIYGASRFRELDLHEVSAYIVNNINFSGCRRLKKIDLSCASGNTTLTSISLHECESLEELNVRGIRSTAFRMLDLSSNKRLEVLDAGNTLLTDIVIAKGAKIRRITYPASTSILQLRGLKNLTAENIIIEDRSNVTRLWIEDCAQIDWEALYATLPSLTHLRIVGINKTGDTTWLNKFLTKGGMSETGSLTDTCALVGTYVLDKYIASEELARLQAHFPELSIRQPEYTTIKFFEKDMMSGVLIDVADPENIQNLDNMTGYGTGKPYQPSGHLMKIFARRHRVLGKQEKKGEMCIFPLHNKNSYFFADSENVKNASPARLGGEDGDIYMYEPAYWYKGINDHEKGCCYGVFSSNIEKPRVPEGKKITYSELVNAGAVQGGKYVHKDPLTLDESLKSFSSRAFSVAKVEVEGWKYINFTYAIDYSGVDVKFGNEKIAHMFVDASGNILKKFSISHLEGNNGCNTVLRIPENAKYFYITFCYTFTSDEHNYIWLTNSDAPQDWECEWNLHEEKLVSIAPVNIVAGKPRCVVTSTKQLANEQTEQVYSELLNAHNLRRLSYNQHKDISVLIFAKYGTRNTNHVRLTGGLTFTYPRQKEAYNLNHLAEFGMQDTDFYDPKTGIPASKFPRYLTVDELGVQVDTKSEHAAIMGYIDYPMQSMFNRSFKVSTEDREEYRIPGAISEWLTAFEDSGRKIPLLLTGNSYAKAVSWGRYLDITQRGTSPALGDKFFLTDAEVRRADTHIFNGFSMHDKGSGVTAMIWWYSSVPYTRVGICEFTGSIRKMSSVDEFKDVEQYKWLR